MYPKGKPAWNRGFCHLSKMAKKSISKKMKERIRKNGHPKGMLGKKHSEETKKKISKSMKKNGWFPPPQYGKKSEEFRKLMSKRFKGDRSHFWKGGKTSLNKIIRESSEYKIWRESVFKRDNYTCKECGQVGGELNADHIKPFALFPKLRFKLSNGRTLCVDCHKKTKTFAKH
jgi:hypothetical protein